MQVDPKAEKLMHRFMREAAERQVFSDILNGLMPFVRESNKIEGINREPTRAELEAHKALLEIKPGKLTIRDVESFVSIVQPNAILRDRPDIPGVRVGQHIAPPSGSKIAAELERIIANIERGLDAPFQEHAHYETVHPFTDGNGRSGRALWLRHMIILGRGRQAIQLGFLHSFYYQTLAAVGPRTC